MNWNRLSVVKAALVCSYYCWLSKPAHPFPCGGLISGSGWVILFRGVLFEDGADFDDALCETLAHRCCIHQLEYTYFVAVLNIDSACSSKLRYLFQSC